MFKLDRRIIGQNYFIAVLEIACIKYLCAFGKNQLTFRFRYMKGQEIPAAREKGDQRC